MQANRIAHRILRNDGTALDAVERGVMVVEADPDDTSVGYGGLPNAEGVVELDAGIMDGTTLDAGSVAALRDLRHPVAVARRVMERTPHVLLTGAGARRFALAQGFQTEELLTPAAKDRYKRWKREGKGGSRGHDTIGMVALAADGTMAASCTTSGLAFKLPGRVGDSPLVGSGFYCDGAAGGAAATGIGEEIIKVCGSYQVVEFMRQGMKPDEAIRRVLDRVVRCDSRNRERFIGFVALRADGALGYAATTGDFKAAVSTGEEPELRDAPRYPAA